MSVPAPVITRGIWIPDPTFSHPIESGKYWTPGATIANYIYPEFEADDHGTGRSFAVNVEPATTNFAAAWAITSGFSPPGVGTGPFTVDATTKVRFRVYVLAKCSGAWTAGSDVLRGLVRAYEADFDPSATPQTTSTIELKTSAGVTFSAATHTTWTLFSGTATLPDAGQGNLNSDIRRYKLELLFRDGTGTGARYIHVAWAGMSIPWNTSDPYTDTLSSWYSAAPSFSARRSSVAGRGLQQQIASLEFRELSATDLALVRQCWYWNDGTPTDDVVSNLSSAAVAAAVNRGQRAPLICAINREGVKKAFYCDMGGLSYGNATGSGSWWPETGGTYSCALTLTERLEQ